MGTDRTLPSSEGTPPRGAALDPALIGQNIAGRFLIEAPLGAGGMGAVYIANQTAVGRRVVVKFLRSNLRDDAGLAERFEREAQAVSQLSCPNTILLFDYGSTEGGQPYMAMEYLDGQTLHEVTRSSGALSALRAIGIVLQVLDSLEEAHEKGIVHRDLKPENIMLVQRAGTRDFVKVLDFGIAKVVGQRDPAPREADAREATPGLTLDGTVVGSPHYMSPEQVRGAKIDARTDIYAVGVILYEMLCGRTPFTKPSAVELMAQHAAAPVQPLHEVDSRLDLPEALETIVLECLEKDPDARPSSASSLAARLRELSTVVVEREAAREQALLRLVGIEPRLPSRRVWLAAAVVVALVAAGIAGWLARGPGEMAAASLTKGDRLFVSASATEIPPWVSVPGPAARGVAHARGLGSQTEALRFAKARAVAGALDIPFRFGADERHFVDELRRVADRIDRAGVTARTSASYWARLAESDGEGGVRYRYDGYVKIDALGAANRRRLQRALAELRYDNLSFLRDTAVRARRCADAERLTARLRRAIAQMSVEKSRKQMLESIAARKLAPCAQRR